MSIYTSLILKSILDDPSYRSERIWTIERSAIVETFKNAGYADRTIKNHLTKSQRCSTMTLLYDHDCVYQKIKNGYVIDVHRLTALCDATRIKTKKVSQLDKIYQGSPPNGDEWQVGGDVEGGEPAEGWVYYFKRYAEGCYNYKLYAAHGAKFKANYWLVSKQGIMSNNAHLNLLKHERYGLFETITMIVQEYHKD